MPVVGGPDVVGGRVGRMGGLPGLPVVTGLVGGGVVAGDSVGGMVVDVAWGVVVVGTRVVCRVAGRFGWCGAVVVGGGRTSAMLTVTPSPAATSVPR